MSFDSAMFSFASGSIGEVASAYGDKAQESGMGLHSEIAMDRAREQASGLLANVGVTDSSLGNKDALPMLAGQELASALNP